MAEQHLISAAELEDLLASDTPTVLLDCGFDLSQPDAGEHTYRLGHLPGALYAHLDRALAGPKHPGGARDPDFSGRHPLPDRADFARRVGHWGINAQTTVVCYDDQGSPYAARAWWLLRWLGHAQVMVLDGGRAAWVASGAALDSAASVAAPQPPYPANSEPAMPTIDAASLRDQLGQLRVLDARNLERWRGDAEPLDPVAGHIPGSTPRFFKDNLRPDGRFKSSEQLLSEFAARGVSQAQGVVQQCGSGVTACHNLLAMAHAGLGISTLYPGSWSQWCADPRRPVARG